MSWQDKISAAVFARQSQRGLADEQALLEEMHNAYKEANAELAQAMEAALNAVEEDEVDAKEQNVDDATKAVADSRKAIRLQKKRVRLARQAAQAASVRDVFDAMLEEKDKQELDELNARQEARRQKVLAQLDEVDMDNTTPEALLSIMQTDSAPVETAPVETVPMETVPMETVPARPEVAEPLSEEQVSQVESQREQLKLGGKDLEHLVSSVLPPQHSTTFFSETS